MFVFVHDYLNKGFKLRLLDTYAAKQTPLHASLYNSAAIPSFKNLYDTFFLLNGKAEIQNF